MTTDIIFGLNKNELKIVLLSSLGGALEFYDFVIYVIFAPIISQIFFPKSDQLASLMSVYAIFAIGYLVRPLGGALFSHFGDKYGRKKTFIFSVMLMAIPTLVIGLLPSYHTIGILASFMLIALRLLQGLSIGGEIPGALTFSFEHVDSAHHGLACGIIFAFFNLGIILGTLVNLLLSFLLSHDQLIIWGWRVPFILGGFLGAVSFSLRKKMTETPQFIAFQYKAKQSKIPFIEAVTNHWPNIIKGISLSCLGAIVINLLFLYLPTYLTTILFYPHHQVSFLNSINVCLYTATIIAASWLSDNIGKRLILFIGSLGFTLLGYLLFAGLAQQTTSFLVTMMILITLLSGCIMVYPCILVELFPVSIRYTGVAIAYNFSFAIFGGLTPLIATYLIKSTGNILTPSYYLIIAAIFCLLTTMALKK